ncbi:MAG: right-handed parallel beta-helix repeat-containing protein, partial [Anaerolineales bacterium]
MPDQRPVKALPPLAPLSSRLYRTLVTQNVTARVRGGGGLSNEAAGTAILEECVFSKNQATLQQPSSAQWSWGGGIFNGGKMDIIRCSIHGNQADTVGGIFNAFNGDLQIFNSTISNNTAKYNYGALANNHPSFALGNTSAQVRLFHTTIGPNSGGNGNSTNFVYSKQAHQIWFSNSVLDVGCVNDQYTYGRSVMRQSCITDVDPQHGFDIYTDAPNTDPGLLPLTSGSLPVPQMMVQPLNGASAALNIGRDDEYGCSHPLIDQKDQNLAARGAGEDLCDAGALEGGTLKPVYTSNPSTGLIQFPIVSFLGGPGESFVNLGLSNGGGGALEYKIELEDSPAITLISNSSGVLFQNMSTNIQFRCNPPGVNDYWARVLVTTNGSNKKKADYKLRCTGAGEGPQASSSEQPGPVNLPPAEPGQTANGTLIMSNNGTQPLDVNGAWKTPGGGFNSSGLLAPDQPVEDAGVVPAAPEGGPWTLQPGQSVTIHLSCTPPNFGLFTNTFQVTTSDPF